MKKLQKIFLLFLLTVSTLFSADVEKGKDLYHEAKCQKCHTPESFTSDKRKVKDFAKLQWRVKRCDFTMSAGWSDKNIADVVHYLNENFYKFKK